MEKYFLAITAIAQQMAKAGDTEFRRQEFESAIGYYINAIKYLTTSSVLKVSKVEIQSTRKTLKEK